MPSHGVEPNHGQDDEEGYSNDPDFETDKSLMGNKEKNITYRFQRVGLGKNGRKSSQEARSETKSKSLIGVYRNTHQLNQHKMMSSNGFQIMRKSS
mmetsp:Transcript_36829/g.35544  ORF Transcript_36829/g.35544 Transcript_36829/m.35544 type:complete len:96 (-) Transcript_36829:702-989(-)